MSDPDIDLLLRLRKRLPRLRELASKHPEDADDLDLIAYDFEHVWTVAKRALGRVAQLESTPGVSVQRSAVSRLPSVALEQPAAAREVYEPPAYERAPQRRPSSVVSFVIEGVEPGDVRIGPAVEMTESPTAYAEIKRKN